MGEPARDLLPDEPAVQEITSEPGINITDLNVTLNISATGDAAAWLTRQIASLLRDALRVEKGISR